MMGGLQEAVVAVGGGRCGCGDACMKWCGGGGANGGGGVVADGG